jgi:hypothetical protein
MKRLIAAALTLTLGWCAAQGGQYRNFRAAIYVTASATRDLADPAAFERQYARVARQIKFDKIYIEVYRYPLIAGAAEIEQVKQLFAAKGVTVAGGVSPTSGTFDYEDPLARSECQRAVELAAAHFDEVIVGDSFFFAAKSDADIKAKGAKSWTQYRIDAMREAAADLVVAPAKKVNPNVRVVIKYPAGYEHFHELGYDLEKQSRLFDGIYAGGESRDIAQAASSLPQYQSYESVRYFDNVRPKEIYGGGNGGGWADAASLRTNERYIEHVQDILFAKAPEITLFDWTDMAGSQSNAVMTKPHRAAKGDAGPGRARTAGIALERVDAVLAGLGKPIGIAAYQPYRSHGEDYLPGYLGNIGLPIEMSPNFPIGADLILITENAKFDPDIISKIKLQLTIGKNVLITSGFLAAMQDNGLKDIVEWEVTGRKAPVRDFAAGFGAATDRNNAKLPAIAVLLPEIRYADDAKTLVRGTAGAKGYPVLLAGTYSKGTVILLVVPDNPSDLSSLPQDALSRMRTYLQEDAKVRLDAPSPVGLFVYDNDALVVRNYRDDPAVIRLSVAGEGMRLGDLATGRTIAATPARNAGRRGRDTTKSLPLPSGRTVFSLKLPPHSFAAYRLER